MDFNDPNQEPEYEGKQHYATGIKGFAAGIVAGILIFAVAGALFPSVRTVISDLPFAAKTDVSMDQQIQRKIDTIYEILDRYYVDDYDKAETVESMYYGLVQGIGDPYTSYMNSAAFVKFREDTEGQYAGIGVTVSVDTTDNTIVVVTLFEGYPGAQSGMLPGDKIVSVNGHDVSGDTLDDAVSMMKGQPGTSVDVTIYRPSEKQMHEMTLTREKIDIPTVSHKMLDNGIAYIRITNFDRITYDQFMKAYNDVKGEMTGLILDLRGNPGGLLDVVVKITNVLVPEGIITYTEDKYGKREDHKSDANAIQVPLLLLVNGGSASASEVLSGAVKDMGVGQLVGTRTFGKGLVQNIFPMSDGSAIKATIAKYYTPNGVCIQGEGIEPDYPVEMSDKLSIRISSLSLEEDAQLSAAIDIMHKKLGIE